MRWWREGTPQARKALSPQAWGGCSTPSTSPSSRWPYRPSAPSWGLSGSEAGGLGSVTLLGAAAGGVFFGFVAGSVRPHARTHLECRALFHLHCRLRLRHHLDAVGRVPHAPRDRHGRGVGKRCRARLRNLAGGTSWQGARLHAERLGDRLCRSRARQCRGPAGFRMARGLLRRHPARVFHSLGPAQRRGAADLESGAEPP